jgi:hypothetical protein
VVEDPEEKGGHVPDQSVATAQTGRRWGRTLLIAAVLAAMAVVLFAASAFSSSGGSSSSGGGSPAVEQIQQTPQQGRNHDCPDRSGGNQQSTSPSDASLDV